MSQRFFNPLAQFVDSTGLPLGGAQLFFYEAGTSTKLDTYSNEILSSANTNPVVLDSDGRLPGDVFLLRQDYKVILAPSTDSDPPSSPIFTADPVRSSDFSTVGELKVGSGDPNSNVAGTAGSASVLPTQYWDFTNDVLYFCTTTGTTSTAVWTAINGSSAAASPIPPPGGRLTPSSGDPVITQDQSSKTSIFYSPYIGDQVPIYDGSNFVPITFAELTLALATQHSVNEIYDVFVWLESSVITIGTGPAWTNSTMGSGNRGSGAGTTELALVEGFNTNAVSMTTRNGAATFSVSANLATYLGSILIDGTAGQVSCDFEYGQSRIYGVWNYYNRMPIHMRMGDATASWTYSTAAIRESNNATANKFTTLVGVAEEIIRLAGRQKAQGDATGSDARIGFGVDTTAAISGFSPLVVSNISATSLDPVLLCDRAITPDFGGHEITSLEETDGNQSTFFGGEDEMLFTCDYMG